MNYYQLLELSPTASAEDIDQQYKLFLHAWHPDKFPPGKHRKAAEERTKLYNHARDVLRDPEKRKEYDLELQRQAQTPNARSRGRGARSSDYVVYATSRGRFHRQLCEWLNLPTAQKLPNRSAAITAGYKPCRTCQP